jgi:hypothetical protein
MIPGKLELAKLSWSLDFHQPGEEIHLDMFSLGGLLIVQLETGTRSFSFTQLSFGLFVCPSHLTEKVGEAAQ